MEAFGRLTNDNLKPFAKMFVYRLPTRKGELVAIVAGADAGSREVRTLYEQLPQLGRQAVQEAAWHDPRGHFHPDRFEAKYGACRNSRAPMPGQSSSFSSYGRHHPTRLALFFPHSRTLPTDLRETLPHLRPCAAGVSTPRPRRATAGRRADAQGLDGT